MTVLIFSGGVGLGAYQAGAYQRLQDDVELLPSWIVGASIGAINAAVIAGSAPSDRLAKLKELWHTSLPQHRTVPNAFNSYRHTQNWASALKTRLLGSPGHFVPRLHMPWQTFSSFYDLSPLAERLLRLIDFDRLNRGEVRLTVAATDLETGDPVFFDTGRGDRIDIEHLMASCGFLPEFAPVEIEGRLLGDGGLAANAPIEALYLEPRMEAEQACFVVDLYARDGARPAGLEAALSRKNDLIFGNQTWQRLKAYQREQSLRDSETNRIAFYLSYRPDSEEAGPERGFDYSRRSLDTRWHAGFMDMTEAMAQLSSWRIEPGEDGLSVRAIRRAQDT
jgi:NTE family protein